MNGKGDSPRPLSVDARTFSNNWDKIFEPKKINENPEYVFYLLELQSGMFFEWYPALTGEWDKDKTRWTLARLNRLSKQGDINETP